MNQSILKSIITEEFNGLLREVEYQKDDIINPANIDLYVEYDKLNDELFAGELPRVQMQWSKRKGNLGHVKVNFNRETKYGIIKYLAMSSFHAMPYRVFRNTLAHEMIHIKQTQDRTIDRRNPHGYDFMIEAERINNMGLGFKITKRSEEQLGISDTMVNNKMLVAIMMNIDGRDVLALTTPNVFRREGDRVFQIYEALIKQGKYRNIKFVVVESKNVKLLKYRQNRSFNTGVSYGPLPDELRDELSQDRVLIRVEIPPNGMSEDVNDASNWEEIIIV